VPAVLGLIFVALALYAALGKGFAYAGWPPFFVGELLLVIVLAAAIRTPMALPRQWTAWLALGLVGIAAVQATIESIDGGSSILETVRGLAPVYYAGFAFGLYALLRAWEDRIGRPPVLAAVEDGLRMAAPWVLVVLGVLAALAFQAPSWLPRWPVSGVPVMLTKPGDISVGLILVLGGLWAPGAATAPRWRALMTAGWFVVAVLMVFRSRGALLSLAAGIVVMRPNPLRLARGAFVATAVVVVLYATGLTVGIGGREISYDAIGDAAASVLGGQGDGEISSNYLDTTNWRARWWEAIWDDVTADRMVVHGHGWGDNLAVRYHVVAPVATDDPRVLRLPHDIFFSLAARAGVLFAIAFLFVPIATVARTFDRRYRKRPSVAVEAARGAVVAAVVTGLTDIYLESPQGGILFWSLIGFLWWATAPLPAGAGDARQAR
jgi:hypothetical protein